MSGGGVRKRITHLRRRDDVSPEEFRTHWRTTHAEIARDLPGVVAYVQNHVIAGGEGAFRIDGIVELWFGAPDAFGAAYGSDIADRLAADEVAFLDGLTGAPVHADPPGEPGASRLWIIGGTLPEQADLPGLVRVEVNETDRGGQRLVRERLASMETFPDVATALVFRDAASAERALPVVTRLVEGTEARLLIAEPVTVIAPPAP